MESSLEKVTTPEDRVGGEEKLKFQKNRGRLIELETQKTDRESALKEAGRLIHQYTDGPITERGYWFSEVEILELQIQHFKEHGQELPLEKAWEEIHQRKFSAEEVEELLQEIFKARDAEIPTPSEEELLKEKEAKGWYREIAHRCHPDLYPGDERRTEIFRQAAQAWEEGNFSTLAKLHLLLEEEGIIATPAEPKENLEALRERNKKLDLAIKDLEERLENLQNNPLMPFAQKLRDNPEEAYQTLRKQRETIYAQADGFKKRAEELKEEYRRLTGGGETSPAKAPPKPETALTKVVPTTADLAPFLRKESRSLTPKELGEQERWNSLTEKLASFFERQSREGPITPEEIAQSGFSGVNRKVSWTDAKGRDWEVSLWKESEGQNLIFFINPEAYYKDEMRYPSLVFGTGKPAQSDYGASMAKKINWKGFEIAKEDPYPYYIIQTDGEAHSVRFNYTFPGMEKFAHDLLSGERRKNPSAPAI